MNTESRKVQKIIDNMNAEELAKSCLMHLCMEAETQKVPSLIRQKFLLEHQEALKKPAEDTGAIPYFMMMIEELINTTSRIIVTLASLGPSTLASTLTISEAKTLLIRRALEEEILQIVVQGLKKGTVDNHTNYSEFIKQKEKERE